MTRFSLEGYTACSPRKWGQTFRLATISFAIAIMANGVFFLRGRYGHGNSLKISPVEAGGDGTISRRAFGYGEICEGVVGVREKTCLPPPVADEIAWGVSLAHGRIALELGWPVRVGWTIAERDDTIVLCVSLYHGRPDDCLVVPGWSPGPWGMCGCIPVAIVGSSIANVPCYLVAMLLCAKAWRTNRPDCNRWCRQCGHDLVGIAADCRCPECGSRRAYPKASLRSRMEQLR